MTSALKKSFYISFATLFLSGLVHVLLDTFFRVSSELGETLHPLQFWFLRLHSVSGLWFLFLFGYIFARHVQPKLKHRKNRISGLIFLSMLITLSLSAPALFYLVNESLKQAVTLSHIYLGLIVAIPFYFHSILQKG